MTITNPQYLKDIQLLQRVEITALEFPLKRVQQFDRLFLALCLLELVEDALDYREEMGPDLELNMIATALDVEEIVA